MISIYMSDDKIKVVEGAVKGKKFYVIKLIELNSNLGSLETGTLKNPLDLSQTIEQILNENGIKRQKTVVVLDNFRTVLKSGDFPALSDKKLKTVLLNETPGDKQKTTVIDYIIDSKFKDPEDGQKKFHLQYIVFQNPGAIQAIDKSMKEIGLKLQAIDIAPNATSKMFSTFFGRAIPQTSVLIDFKDTFWSLYIFENGERKHSQSNQLYNKPSTEQYGDDDSFVQELQDNIAMATKYYTEKNPGASFDGIYVTGNITPFSEDVIQKLANATKLKVKHLPLPENVVAIDINDFNKYSCALGAMIRRD